MLFNFSKPLGTFSGLNPIGRGMWPPGWSYQKIWSIRFDLRGGADAVNFRTQTKIKIYSFNFKDPSRFNFVV